MTKDDKLFLDGSDRCFEFIRLVNDEKFPPGTCSIEAQLADKFVSRCKKENLFHQTMTFVKHLKIEQLIIKDVIVIDIDKDTSTLIKLLSNGNI